MKQNKTFPILMSAAIIAQTLAPIVNAAPAFGYVPESDSILDKLTEENNTYAEVGNSTSSNVGGSSVTYTPSDTMATPVEGAYGSGSTNVTYSPSESTSTSTSTNTSTDTNTTISSGSSGGYSTSGWGTNGNISNTPTGSVTTGNATTGGTTTGTTEGTTSPESTDLVVQDDTVFNPTVSIPTYISGMSDMTYEVSDGDYAMPVGVSLENGATQYSNVVSTANIYKPSSGYEIFAVSLIVNGNLYTLSTGSTTSVDGSGGTHVAEWLNDGSVKVTSTTPASSVLVSPEVRNSSGTGYVKIPMDYGSVDGATMTGTMAIIPLASSGDTTFTFNYSSGMRLGLASYGYTVGKVSVALNSASPWTAADFTVAASSKGTVQTISLLPASTTFDSSQAAYVQTNNIASTTSTTLDGDSSPTYYILPNSGAEILVLRVTDGTNVKYLELETGTNTVTVGSTTTTFTKASNGQVTFKPTNSANGLFVSVIPASKSPDGSVTTLGSAYTTTQSEIEDSSSSNISVHVESTSGVTSSFTGTKEYEKGETVSITLTPNSGATIDSITVTASTGDTKAIQKKQYATTSQNYSDGIVKSITNVNGTITITLDTTDSGYASYYIEPEVTENFNVTLPSSSDYTINSSSSSFTKGDPMTFTISPVDGKDIETVILSLAGYGTLSFDSTRTQTISDVSYKATWNSDGSVTMTISSMERDIGVSVTSVTSGSSGSTGGGSTGGDSSNGGSNSGVGDDSANGDASDSESEYFKITTQSDDNCYFNVTNGTMVEAGKGHTVVATPYDDHAITSVTIVVNGQGSQSFTETGTFYLGNGNENIRAEFHADGSVSMTVFDAVADVTFIASTKTEAEPEPEPEPDPTYYTINTRADENCIFESKSSQALEGNGYSISVVPKDGYNVTSVTITVDGQGSRSFTEDKTYAIGNANYSVAFHEDGSASLTAHDVQADITFAASTYVEPEAEPVPDPDDIYYTMTAKPDENCSFNDFTAQVVEGEGYTTFVTPHTGHRVTSVNIVVDGQGSKTFTESGSFSIGNNKTNYNATFHEDGSVSLTAFDVQSDITFTASTYVEPVIEPEIVDPTMYTVTTKSDSNCNFTTVGDPRIEEGDGRTVIVYPESGHSITSVAVAVDGQGSISFIDSATLTMGGEHYQAIWRDDGSVAITVYNAKGDITFTASTFEEEIPPQSYMIQTYCDTHTTTTDEFTRVTEGSTALVRIEAKTDRSVSHVVVTSSAGGVHYVTKESPILTINGQEYDSIWADDYSYVLVEVPVIGGNTQVYAHGTRTDLQGKYNFSFNTNGYLNPSFSSGEVAPNTSIDLSITPDNGFKTEYVTVMVDGSMFTFTERDTFATLNGKTYSTVWYGDGSVMLYIPAMSTDVSVLAVSTTSEPVVPLTYELSLDLDKNITSDFETSSLEPSSIKTFSLYPKDGHHIDTIMVFANGQSGTMTIDRTSYTTSNRTYRTHWSEDGTVLVEVPAITHDVSITVTSAENPPEPVITHLVTAVPHKNATATATSEQVVDGETRAITYTASAGYYLTGINVSYFGTTATVLEGTTVQQIAGKEFYFLWDDNSVTVMTPEIIAPLTLSANVSETFGVTVTKDANISATLISGEYKDGERVSFTYTPSSSATEITEITFSANGQVGAANPSNTAVAIAGNIYNTYWNGDGSVTVTMERIGASVAIHAKGQSTTEESPTYHNLEIHMANDIISNTIPGYYLENESLNLVFTPMYDASIQSLEISANGATSAVFENKISTNMAGKIYIASWNNDGTVSLNVPNITSDVSINVVSTPATTGGNGDSNGDSNTQNGTVTVNAGSFATTSFTSGEVGAGFSKNIIISPVEGAAIDSVSLASNGQSESFTESNNIITIGDVTHTALWQADGTVHLTITGSSNNVTLSVVASDSDSSTDGNGNEDGDDNSSYPDVEVGEGQHKVAISVDSNLTSDYYGIAVDDGESATAVFTPNDGYAVDEIVVKSGSDSEVISKDTKTVIVNGVTFYSTWNSDGIVTVYIREVIDDIYFAATSEVSDGSSSDDEELTEFDLVVTTDSYTKSSVTSAVVNKGDDKVVLFTPNSGYNVTNVSIYIDNEKYDIDINDGITIIDGKVYSAEQALNGVITVTLYDIESHIILEAESKKGVYYVNVDDMGMTTTSLNGPNLVESSDLISLKVTPDENVVLEGIRVETSLGGYEADYGDSYLSVNGNKYSITYDSKDDAMTMLISGVGQNMNISPICYKTHHYISFNLDSYTTMDDDLNDDDAALYKAESDQSFTFYPDDYYKVNAIKISYDGESTTLVLDYDDEDKNQFTFGDEEYGVTINANGSVTLNVSNLNADLDVWVSSTKADTNEYTITRNADSRSTISLSSTGPYESGKSVTATMKATSGYKLSEIVISSETDSVTVYQGTKNFRLDNALYYASWNSGVCTIEFASLSSDLEISTTGVTSSATIVLDVHEPYMVGMGNGRFSPDSKITRAEGTVMLVELFYPKYDTSKDDATSPFSDIGTSMWYTDDVEFAYTLGVYDQVIGGNSTFSPTQELTRAELITMLCNISQASISGVYASANVFEDVPSSHWASLYINFAASNGWVVGVGENSFAPDQLVTRAEAVTMMNRVMGRSADKNAVYGTTFSDVPETHWAYYQVIEATNLHKVVGYSSNGDEIWQK